jgi:16S rRNA (cytosine967-C5)-methyltransferase
MRPNAREAAVELLVSVLDEGRTLDEAMARSPAYEALKGRDRSFASAIARCALRHLGRIDRVLRAHLVKPLPETAARARAILRTGAAQLLFMNVAAHAAVSESVEVAGASSKSGGFAKLINAVLRKVAASAPDADPALDLPDWLATRWRAVYGAAAVSAIADAQGREPPLDITARADAAHWTERLGGALLPTGSIRLSGNEPVPDLPGYAEGAWWVQDSAAAIAARLLGDVKGAAVLDLCAAPGGKTLQLAAAGARVTALDISDSRLDRLRRSLARTRLHAELVCADALAWTPPATFDAVLLDAPCSATGTLRRHPEAAWLRTPAHIVGFARTQAALLAASRAFVKPGGRLVYVVCSLEPEEGPAIVEEALARGGWRREPIEAGEVGGLPDLLTPDGDLRTLPHHLAELGGMDGFYAARLVRIAD